jgi:hypothetical protein
MKGSEWKNSNASRRLALKDTARLFLKKPGKYTNMKESQLIRGISSCTNKCVVETNNQGRPLMG